MEHRVTVNDNFIGVGGLVLRDNDYLMVKHAYGEYRGFWILPGGRVWAGEAIHKAVEREIHEETGITAEARNVIALRSRCRNDTTTDLYIVFLMKYKAGEPVADGREVDDARFFSGSEVMAMDNVIVLSRIIVGTHMNNALHMLPRNTLFDPYTPDCHEAQLFM
jgi:8-oxo-dGTP diphosphatase